MLHTDTVSMESEAEPGTVSQLQSPISNSPTSPGLSGPGSYSQFSSLPSFDFTAKHLIRGCWPILHVLSFAEITVVLAHLYKPSLSCLAQQA